MRKIPFLLPLLAAAVLGGCAAPGGGSGQADVAPPDPSTRMFATYLSARFAAQQHDMPQAARFYTEALRSDPANPNLLALAFFYSATAGHLEAAGRLAQRVVAETPDDRAARMALAVVAFHHKDYAAVRRNLAASAKGPFTVLTVSLFDAWAAAAMGDKAAVAADIKTLAAQSGAEGVAAFHAALIADFMGLQDAGSLYARAAMAGSRSPRVVEAFGRYLERQGRAADATRLYESIRVEPALAPVADAGLARIAKGEKPAPLVTSAEEGAAEGLFGIAASLSDGGSADISILYLRMALYLRPDLTLAKILLADRFEQIGKYEEAVAIYEGIDRSSPYYRMAAVEAALNETRLNHNDKAIESLKALAATGPMDADTWIALGDAYRSDNRFAEAIDAYDHAQKALGTPAKKDWPLFYARAMAEDRAGQWDKAEADVHAGLKLSPDQPELLNYLGYSWVDRGEHIEEALAMLEKARSLRPNDGYIVDSVGWAYYRLGRYDEAARTLETAVLLVPGDPTINDHLGDALWKAGRRMEARFQWNHALAFSPETDEKNNLEEKLRRGLTG